MILPFHTRDDEPLNRMLNAVQPGSYIRPHRHLTPPKAESIVVLRGTIGFLTFDESGTTLEATRLSASLPAFGVDCRPGVFHTFVSLEPDTVVFEVKPGPYVRASDKDFAQWAPKEWSEEAPAYLAKLEKAFAG